jgi:hypothetical protein
VEAVEVLRAELMVPLVGLAVVLVLLLVVQAVAQRHQAKDLQVALHHLLQTILALEAAVALEVLEGMAQAYLAAVLVE